MARSESCDGDDQNDGSGDCELLPELGLNDPPTRCRLTPPIVSDLVVGSGRSHSRHRRRRRRHRTPAYSKSREVNIVASICSMIAIILFCTSLAEPHWIYLRGGGCRDMRGNIVNYLGANQFFYLGHFVENSENAQNVKTVYVYGEKDTDALINCVTKEIASIMRSMIVMCLLSVALSASALLLDLLGPTHKVLRTVRRSGLLNILTVVLCIVINGFCYWATEDLFAFQQLTKLKIGSRITINFGASFYLITAAASISVIAASCNLLRRHPAPSPTRRHRHDQDLESLLGEIEAANDISGACLAPALQPSPPPYSP